MPIQPCLNVGWYGSTRVVEKAWTKVENGSGVVECRHEKEKRRSSDVEAMIMKRLAMKGTKRT